jgi:hypothetical protein
MGWIILVFRTQFGEFRLDFFSKHHGVCAHSSLPEQFRNIAIFDFAKPFKPSWHILAELALDRLRQELIAECLEGDRDQPPFHLARNARPVQHFDRKAIGADALENLIVRAEKRPRRTRRRFQGAAETPPTSRAA